ncbi:hypothetical protein OsI_12211 [Oryza sativa Indica Group]|uniref:Uncharacterized protein n=1 Tax=Oryza sativa subsp. indica TaxID=39946 RepID=B8AKH3_ORYSI|nr:hypothetical protein OsI_12211 [Oryza sativa Indica Group]
MAPRAAALVLAAVLMITMIACGAARKKDAVSMPRRLHDVTAPPTPNRRALLRDEARGHASTAGCCTGHRSGGKTSGCIDPPPCPRP